MYKAHVPDAVTGSPRCAYSDVHPHVGVARAVTRRAAADGFGTVADSSADGCEPTTGTMSVTTIALASTILLVLVLLARTIVEKDRLRARTRGEATTDPLTGLGNRRKLVTDLAHRLEHSDPDPTLLLVFDLNGFKAYNDDFGHTAGDALLTRLARKLSAVPGPEGATYRLGGDEFGLIARVGEGDAEGLIDRASLALSEHSEGFRIGSSFGGVLLPYEATDPSEALRLADERLYGQKRWKQGIRTVNALVEALSGRKAHEHVPTDGVQALAVVIGRMLGLHGEKLEALARAAELHDVGALSIPDDILGKPGPLDEREWEFVRGHTLVGERILHASPRLWGVASIVRATHENWDGTGYPDGLAGTEIPHSARIIAACNAFDAMTSPRPYREALTCEEALAELESRSGTNFDPAVVRVLSALVRARLEAEQAA
jgi:two-component system cell cycle response regulator